jgi:hypothetical protein
MRKLFMSLLAVAAMGAAVTISSCTKTCDAGYEGSKCDTKMNAKFVGTYTVVDTATFTSGSPAVFTYTMGITANSSNPQGVNITNFGGFNAGSTISGTVNGTNLTVANTTIGGIQISNASGSINNNTLSFTYTATDTTGTSVDHAVGVK